MITIHNDLMDLTAANDDASITLTNRRTGSRWVLDPATVLADGSRRDRVPFGATRNRGHSNLVADIGLPAIAFQNVSVRGSAIRPSRSASRVLRASSSCSTNSRTTAAV